MRQWKKRKLPFFLLCIFVLLSTMGARCQPTIQTKVIDLGGLVLLFGSGPNTLVKKQYTFYAGNPTSSVSITMDLNNLSNSCPLQIISGDGNIAETIVNNGRISTVAVPGNVVTVSADCINANPTPSVTMVSMTLQQSGAVFPEITKTPSNMSSSYPLKLNSPIELVFPAGSNMTYFFTLDNIMGKNIDYVLDSTSRVDGGIAEVLISDDLLGFILDRENAIHVVENGFESTSFPRRDTLLLTVRNREGRAGNVRFSVNEIKDALSLRLRFMIDPAAIPSAALPGPVRDILQNPDPEIQRKINLTSRILYLASGGRIRVESLAAYRSMFVDIRADADIRVYPFPTNELSRRVPAFQELQRDKIILGYEFLDPSRNDTMNLAQEILRVRYGMSFEGNLCPNSLMGGNFMTGLCWDGNHNPYNSSEISGQSMWRILSERLGIENPSTSPPLVLFNVSNINFPLNYTSFR